MRTLVICDDYWHPASTTRAGLHALGDCGFEFEWSKTQRIGRLKTYLNIHWWYSLNQMKFLQWTG